ncbi:MAG: SRPBCC family protein [Rubricoccaceae bacterium]|nr:SRPBCC family protein [Rubricoccaceae bacterium]
MNDVQRSVTIDAPRDRVWDVLSDLTAMRAYMPGLASVEHVGEAERGVGAARHCVFADGVELTERVTDWREGTGYTLETTAFKGVPMASNEIRFVLSGDARQTTVTQSMRYAMKGGILAPLLERMAKGRMVSALDGALGGLKEHVEARVEA